MPDKTYEGASLVLKSPKGGIGDRSPSQVIDGSYMETVPLSSVITYSRKNEWVLERSRCKDPALP
jgi:hypothetical protein